MHKKINNILFVFLLFFIMGFIYLFNYFMDPYDLTFDREPSLQLSQYDKDMIGSVLKLSKTSKYDVLVIGASTTNSFILNDNQKYAFITYGLIPLEKLLEYTTFFLEIHPEIKTVIFPIEYTSYFVNQPYDFPVIKSKNLTLQESIRLFIALKTTRLSISKFLKHPRSIYYNIKETKQYLNREYFQSLSPPRKDIKVIKNPDIKENFTYKVLYNYQPTLLYIQENVYKYLDKIINLLEDGDFEVQYIIPPYHALLQAKMSKEGKYKDVEDIKRFFVERTNKPVWDFAYINKYTTQNLKTTYLYSNIEHPITYKYNTFYCALINPEKYKGKDIFIDLTKDNIDSVLEYQRDSLQQYILDNNENINDFLDIKDYSKFIEKSTQEIPPSEADCTYSNTLLN